MPGIEQDELQKQSILAYIEKHVGTFHAVLILANSTVTTGGMDYVLRTLSTILPKPLANNVGLVFTNTRPPFIQDFPQVTLPEELKAAPQFAFDDPIAICKYNSAPLLSMAEAEERSLKMLVKLFNWLDSLEPQSTTEIIRLRKLYQDIQASATSTFAQVSRAAARQAEINKLTTVIEENSSVSLSPCLHWLISHGCRRGSCFKPSMPPVFSML